MRVMLTQRNQITIPRNLIDELNLQLGKFYELEISDDKISLNISQAYDQIEDNTNVIPKIVDNTNSNIKIESNLEEGKKFSRQVYSDCGLVIRTKRSYINKFCETCQGQLAREYGVDTHPCIYCINDKKEEPKENITLSSKPATKIETPIIKYEEVKSIKKEEPKPEIKLNIKEDISKPGKTIISHITNNVEKLSNKLDKEIKSISKECL